MLTDIRAKNRAPPRLSSVVQPKFNGAQWNDVLRAQIPLDNPALAVNIRVYGIERR